MRPDLDIVPFRGNVQTRIDKVKAGQVDATFLAMAGLERLGLSDSIIHGLSDTQMLPACGQGIVCMETREGDKEAQSILDKVNCTVTALCAVAEREVLKALDGSCHTPISAYAEINGDRMSLRVEVYRLDGQEVFKKTVSSSCSSVSEAQDIGKDVGCALNDILPEGFLL